MKFFGSRHRTHRPERAPTRRAQRGPVVPLSDPIAQAMRAGDRRSADALWIGGITFRVDK